MADRFTPPPRVVRLRPGRRRTSRPGATAECALVAFLGVLLIAWTLLWEPVLREGFTVLLLLVATWLVSL